MKKMLLVLSISVLLFACTKEQSSPVDSVKSVVDVSSSVGDTIVLPSGNDTIFSYIQQPTGTAVTAFYFIVETDGALPPLNKFSVYFNGVKKIATITYSNDSIIVAMRHPNELSGNIALKAKITTIPNLR